MQRGLRFFVRFEKYRPRLNIFDLEHSRLSPRIAGQRGVDLVRIRGINDQKKVIRITQRPARTTNSSAAACSRDNKQLLHQP
jgi:hypothetical protein